MKIGRNDPCPCGSGKKYKKCCLGKNEDNEIETARMMLDTMMNLRKFMLKQEPQIKKYHHLRHIHSDILDSMIDYLNGGKYDFNQELKKVTLANRIKSLNKKEDLKLCEYDIDFDNDAEVMFFYGLSIYKNSENMNSISEIYLAKNKFKNKEKIELLKAMNQAYTSIFEIIDVELFEGYVNLIDIFTGKKYRIIDEGLSGTAIELLKNEYLYTRIITVGDISFGNCSLLVDKKNVEINNFIEKYKKGKFSVLDLSIQFFRISKENLDTNYRVNNIS